MKAKFLASLSALLLGCHLTGAETNALIPWEQIGAKAGADYKGDGLGIRPTPYTTDMSVNPSTYASVADVVNISQPQA